MTKLRVGNSANSKINGEYAGHVRRFYKKITSGMRRSRDKVIIKNEILLLGEFQQNLNIMGGPPTTTPPEIKPREEDEG